MKKQHTLDKATKHIKIETVRQSETRSVITDQIAVEAPLSITFQSVLDGQVVQKPYLVTMCTPGQDFELVKGLLWSEEIIHRKEDILDIRVGDTDSTNGQNIIVHLSTKCFKDLKADTTNFEFVARTSCGICGKASIDEVFKHSCYTYPKNSPQITQMSLLRMPEELRKMQKLFHRTGGVHAAGLFDDSGQILKVYEDIGRHNALDKLIGAALEGGLIPLKSYGILLSGRASFELVQKSWMAGAPIVVSVGPPSSLGVELALDCGMTLIGFLSDKRFNIYSHPERVV